MIWIESESPAQSTRPPIINAPFRKPVHALAAAAAFLAATLAPALTEALLPPPPATVYSGMPATYGNYYTIASELLKPGDIDVLIVGASDAWTSLDPRIIKAGLEADFDRPMRVLNLSTNWGGLDRDYSIVRDVLRTHKVKLLLIPETDAAQSNPHELSKYFWRPGRAPAGLDMKSRAKLYMMSVIGYPRQLWARFQNPETAPLEPAYEEYLAAQTHRLGFNAAQVGWKSHSETDESNRLPYSFAGAPPLSIETEDLFYPGSPNDYFETRSDYFKFQEAFILAIRDEVRSGGGTFATFSIPTHFGSTPMEKAWLRNLPTSERDWPVIGIPMTQLFPGLDFDQMKAFYTNESHLNEAGAFAYTTAMMPAIKELYTDATDR